MLATSALVSVLGLAGPSDLRVHAADLYWNGTLTDGSGLQGGNGSWYPANTINNWSNDAEGFDPTQWSNANTAVFAGTGGLVTIMDGTVSVTGMRFLADGYTLQNGTGSLILAGPGLTEIEVSASSAMISSIIQDAGGGLLKRGNGMLVLSGTNTYTGGTIVSAGTLVAGSSGALGGGGGGTAVASGATLRLSNGVTIADAISLTGFGSSNQGALQVASGSATVSGDVILTAASSIGLANASTLTLSGTLGGAFTLHRTSSDGGTLVLTGNNSRSQTSLNIAEGALSIADQTNLPGGTLTLNTGNTGTDGLRVTGSDVTISKNITAGFSGARVTNENTVTLSGVIGGGGSTATRVIFTKAGSGKLILTGNNTYAVSPTANAGTQVLGGVLSITDDTNLGGGAVLLNGGGLEVTGTGAVVSRDIKLQTNATVSATNSATVSGVISGARSLTKEGAGTLILTGANTFTGSTTISAGTLQIAADTALGNGGGLTFAGGTLATTADLSTARNLTVAAGGGTIIPHYGTTLTLAGTVSGAGGLTVGGSGTLVLTGSNTYEGGTTLRGGGTLQIASDANLGAASGGLTFDNGILATTESFASARAITLSASPHGRLARAPARGGGSIDVAAHTELLLSGALTGGGDLTKLGSGTLTLAGTNTYSGGTTIAAGTLVGSAASFGSGPISNQAALVIDQSSDATFVNAIDGSGSFTKRGAGNLNLTGTSGLTGATFVEAGKLSVNGALAGSAVTVLDGAALGGSGTVGALTIKSGGIVAPGNSIGTLTVNGDLMLSPGAIFQAEIAGDGGTDQIAVSGKATITGSNVTITTLDPEVSYQQGQRYALISAAGGIDGSFAGVTTSSAFLDLVIDPRTGEVGLKIQVKDSGGGTTPSDPGAPAVFQTVAQTRNQFATAGALDSLPQAGGTLALYNSLLMLDAASARGAFDQLSGEIHASARTALIEEGGTLRMAAVDRLRAAFGAVGGTPMPTMTYGFAADLAPATTGPMPALRSDRFAVWGQGYGSFGRSDATTNAAGLSRSTGGFLLGADVAAFDTLRFGLLAGYSRTEFKVNGRLSSGESDNYHLGLYGGGQWGALGLRLGASYSWHDVETRRTISFAGFGDRLTSGSSAGTAQLFGEFGYRIDLARIALEPFAGLAYVDLRSDGFAETGGAAALTARSRTTGIGYTTLGLRAASNFALSGMDLTLRGALAWRHAFGDVDPQASLAFSGSTPFSVTGVPIAKNAALLEAGLDLALGKATTFGVSYTGQLATDAQDHAFKANLAVRF